jgi:hypothetical protein
MGSGGSCCEGDNELSGFIKEESFEQLNYYELFSVE